MGVIFLLYICYSAEYLGRSLGLRHSSSAKEKTRERLEPRVLLPATSFDPCYFSQPISFTLVSICFLRQISTILSEPYFSYSLSLVRAMCTMYKILFCYKTFTIGGVLQSIQKKMLSGIARIEQL